MGQDKRNRDEGKARRQHPGYTVKPDELKERAPSDYNRRDSVTGEYLTPIAELQESLDAWRNPQKPGPVNEAARTAIISELEAAIAARGGK